MKLDKETQDAVRSLLNLLDTNQSSFCASYSISPAVFSLGLKLDSPRGISDDSWLKVCNGFRAEVDAKRQILRDKGRLSLAIENMALLERTAEAEQPTLLHPPGGPLPVDAPNYIGRAADRRLREAIAGKVKLSTIAGPIRSGRSSLLIRAEQWAMEAGMRVISLDFALMLGSPAVDSGQVFKLIGTELGLNLSDSASEADFINALRAWLHGDAPHTVLLLDNMDVLSLIDIEVTTPLLLALLRFRSEASRKDSPLSKLMVVTVFTGDMWKQEVASSIMGLSSQSSLSGFTRTQIEDLAKIVLKQSGPFSWMDEVHALFGGHPYLTHLFLDEIRLGGDVSETLDCAREVSGGFLIYLDWLRLRLKALLPDRGQRNRLLNTLLETKRDTPVGVSPFHEKLLMHLAILDSRRRIGAFYLNVVKRLAAIDGRED